MHSGHPSARRIAIVRHPEQLELEHVQSATGYYVPGTHCRQGDILQAVASTGKPVWIERGSFLAPTDVAHISQRFPDPSVVTLVEAGSHFGYDDRVLDPRALALYEAWGLKVSISITDLLAGDGAGSPYRPQWADEPRHISSFLNAIMRIRALWNAGIVVKSHPRAAAFSDSYVTLITQELLNQTLVRKDF
jgi:3-deoxy-D-manno-octulosonic acid (KDO) 8-phosphate synthase